MKPKTAGSTQTKAPPKTYDFFEKPETKPKRTNWKSKYEKAKITDTTINEFLKKLDDIDPNDYTEQASMIRQYQKHGKVTQFTYALRLYRILMLGVE